MRFIDVKVFNNERFSIEKNVETGNLYVSFPVFNGLAEYSEFYFISDEEYLDFQKDEAKLFHFVQECKEQKHDDRLLLKPGRLRGTPV